MTKHPVPEPFCWDESFKVFYDELDAEHKGLFDGIAACAAAKGDKAKFDSLKQKVTEHFAYEEGMMDTTGYENYVSHKNLHAEFRAHLDAAPFPLDDNTVEYAKTWLVQHIKNVDFKYKGKL